MKTGTPLRLDVLEGLTWAPSLDAAQIRQAAWGTRGVSMVIDNIALAI